MFSVSNNSTLKLHLVVLRREWKIWISSTSMFFPFPSPPQLASKAPFCRVALLNSFFLARFSALVFFSNCLCHYWQMAVIWWFIVCHCAHWGYELPTFRAAELECDLFHRFICLICLNPNYVFYLKEHFRFMIYQALSMIKIATLPKFVFEIYVLKRMNCKTFYLAPLSRQFVFV